MVPGYLLNLALQVRLGIYVRSKGMSRQSEAALQHKPFLLLGQNICHQAEPAGAPEPEPAFGGPRRGESDIA